MGEGYWEGEVRGEGDRVGEGQGVGERKMRTEVSVVRQRQWGH
jgi:hypothetical protein